MQEKSYVKPLSEIWSQIYPGKCPRSKFTFVELISFNGLSIKQFVVVKRQIYFICWST